MPAVTRLVVLALLGSLCATALLATQPVLAKVALDAVYAQGMVLQRDRPVRISGSAAEGERVTVQIAGASRSVTAREGRWEATLPPLAAGGPWQLRVSGENEVLVPDIWLGDVWLCSGQSNMAMVVASTDTPAANLAPEDFGNLHLLTVPKQPSASPTHQMEISWNAATTASVSRFSAACYFFGSSLVKHLKVPIGLVDASVGGSTIEAWISERTLEQNPDIPTIRDFFARSSAADEANSGGRRRIVAMPSTLFNGMIAPLAPLPIKGILWYQGDANSGRAYQYLALLKSLAEDWRALWSDPALPFIYVQLSGIGEPRNTATQTAWARLREEQLRAEPVIPDSAMVVSFDQGDSSIHPRSKRPVGERAAIAALAKVYGNHRDFRGPRLAAASFQSHGAAIRFEVFDDCMTSAGAELRGFFLAGKDRNWHPAKASIDGNRVVLASPEVVEPIAVRYAWGDRPTGNLRSCAGLPASPFRTDRWPQ